MNPEAQNTNIFDEVLSVLHGTGQQNADEIANTVRNGCFEYCDGYPDVLNNLTREILLRITSLGVKGEVDTAEKETLLDMAKRYAEIDGKVQAVCRAECPTGALGLFEEDDDNFDDDGNPVIKPCPIKDRLAEIVIAFANKG